MSSFMATAVVARFLLVVVALVGLSQAQNVPPKNAPMALPKNLPVAGPVYKPTFFNPLPQCPDVPLNKVKGTGSPSYTRSDVHSPGSAC